MRVRGPRTARKDGKGHTRYEGRLRDKRLQSGSVARKGQSFNPTSYAVKVQADAMSDDSQERLAPIQLKNPRPDNA